MTKARSESRSAVLFASPWILGFGVFLAYPVLASLYYSFCDYSVLKKPVWIGTANYTDLAHDELFWTALKNTLLYTALSLPLSLIVALALAMLLNTRVKGLSFYRTIFYLPSLVPPVALAVVWLWMLNNEHGLVNNALNAVGVTGPDWLGQPAWSKPSLVLIGMWTAGNAMVIYLAGLQDVPASLYEAADLDGASPWQKTLKVTLPMISPVILFNLIMGIIGSLQVFTEPYVMFPGGAPARSTYFYTLYMFENAFKYHKMGYTCAMGWIMFLIILVLTLIAFRFSEKHVHYGGS